MTTRDPVDRERMHALMMAAIDGEISPADRQELDGAIAASGELEREWRRFRRLKEVTTTMRLQNPPGEVWDRYWHSTYRRVERGLGWVLLSAGATVLAAYWLWHVVEALLADTGSPIVLRIGLLAVLVGGLILIVSVVRERIFTSRRDPYQKEIVR